MDTNEKLTAANIRYLLTMKAFAAADQTIRNSTLADHFHYKKSSIHAMLKHLAAAGMIEKDESNIIRLTEKGADTADRYQAYYSAVDTVINQGFPDFQHRENAILAFLAEIPERDLRRLVQQ
ncbi:MAG: helix-turn-helix domain-containing protein [Oscillospiraceae bacterium]|nr:helix-turn-helix domain-containing protein [Oscillospiraceae bacterium]